MFQTTLSNLIVIYLAAMIGLLFSIWLVADWLRRRRERIANRHIFLCGICSQTFEDAAPSDLARCPHCGALNERDRVREI